MTDPLALMLTGSRLKSPPSDSADLKAALASVEKIQQELASVRQTITASMSPLSMGERAAASHHLAVIAAGLGLLHKAFRLIVAES